MGLTENLNQRVKKLSFIDGRVDGNDNCLYQQWLQTVLSMSRVPLMYKKQQIGWRVY